MDGRVERGGETRELGKVDRSRENGRKAEMSGQSSSDELVGDLDPKERMNEEVRKRRGGRCDVGSVVALTFFHPPSLTP